MGTSPSGDVYWEEGLNVGENSGRVMGVGHGLVCSQSSPDMRMELIFRK